MHWFWQWTKLSCSAHLWETLDLLLKQITSQSLCKINKNSSSNQCQNKFLLNLYTCTRVLNISRHYAIEMVTSTQITDPVALGICRLLASSSSSITSIWISQSCQHCSKCYGAFHGDVWVSWTWHFKQTFGYTGERTTSFSVLKTSRETSCFVLRSIATIVYF